MNMRRMKTIEERLEYNDDPLEYILIFEDNLTESENLNKLENDYEPRSRLAAFNQTRNWDKAENDEAYNIRLIAYGITKNWDKAENDINYEVRKEAYKHTGNWKKAGHDELTQSAGDVWEKMKSIMSKQQLNAVYKKAGVKENIMKEVKK